MKPVSKTAYYCCGIRMMDADSPKPLVNDVYARTLMGDEGLQYWETYQKFKTPNGASLARIFLIDNWIKTELTKNPDSNILLIGAGLDSRAFRFPGGNWIELDEPNIIEYKNQHLPAHQAQNPLQRLSIDFQQEKLADTLSPFVHLAPVIIVVEGVLMYLTHTQRSDLLSTITTLFKDHLLLCDLMNERFFNVLGKRGIHLELSRSGASFQDLEADPAATIQSFGYSLDAFYSNPATAADHGLIPVPKLIVKTLFRKFFQGYATYKFSYHKK